jgi:cysteinyl-tRNA synthetase
MARRLALAILPLLVGSAAAFGGVPSVLPPGRHVAAGGHAPHGRLARLCELQRRSGAGFLWRSGGGRPRRVRWDMMAMAAGDVPKAIKIYNTLARDKVDFTPMAADGKTVKMYTCGPTIYDFAHIGNFRAFLTYDIVKRWLQYCGYDVDHVCNLTDVDDKIIVRMKRDNVGLKELTDKYAQYFFEDLDSLNIIPARCYPRATEHIDDIVEMIDGLVCKGNAYEQDGSYYFDVSSFPTYGKLARLDFDNMQDGASEGGGITDSEAFAKKNSRDFALWKAFKPEDSSVVWETRLGKGRPGWHIECSAMSRRFLGDSIDIHAGGVDLTFPHHENEIAQSEAFCGCTYCNVWVHNGFVNIDNEKMSKSLGNFRTLREACKDALDVRAFRYVVRIDSWQDEAGDQPGAARSPSDAPRTPVTAL